MSHPCFTNNTFKGEKLKPSFGNQMKGEKISSIWPKEEKVEKRFVNGIMRGLVGLS